MTRVIEGSTDGRGIHLGIAVASWNRTITDRLLDGALARCREAGVSDVTVLRVPGALELPVAASRLLDSGCDAVVAIGTVVKGETDHYEVVVRESSNGLTAVSIAAGKPVCNAVLAVHDMEAAFDRSGPGAANKGHESVDAALVTVTALRDLGTNS